MKRGLISIIVMTVIALTTYLVSMAFELDVLVTLVGVVLGISTHNLTYVVSRIIEKEDSE